MMANDMHQPPAGRGPDPMGRKRSRKATVFGTKGFPFRPQRGRLSELLFETLATQSVFQAIVKLLNQGLALFVVALLVCTESLAQIGTDETDYKARVDAITKLV